MIGLIAATRRYFRAERALCVNGITEYAAGTEGETPEFLRLNSESTAAALEVPPWIAPLIGWYLVHRLHYFARTGGTG